MPRKDEDHLAAIEAVLRGENTTGFSDKKIILAHARAMHRRIRQLEEALQMQGTQLDLFTQQEDQPCSGTP